MNRAYSEKRRFALDTVGKVLLGLFAVLVALTVVLSIMQRFGLTLVNGTLMLYLPVLAVLLLVGWGVYMLVRRIKSNLARTVVIGVLVLVLMLVLVVAFSYISFMAAITVPQRFSQVQSPSGAHRLIVFRTISAEEERVEAHRAARLAADPDGDPEAALQDWGFVYRAYPPALGGLFYRSNADVEGEVYLAYYNGVAVEPAEGEAAVTALPCGTLMVEWLDDESTAHFYVQDPGPGEGGEFTVKF